MTDDNDDPVSAGVKDRRAHRRARVLWGGRLRRAETRETLPCTVTNISAGGARLLLDTQAGRAAAAALATLEPGVPITLDLSSTRELPGEVVWREDHQMGMKFHLTAEDVAERVGSIVEVKPGE